MDPNNAEAHNNLGRTLYKLDRLEEAILNFRKSIDIDPDIALVHYNLGQAFHKAGELEQSELSYKKAISLKQNYIEAYSNLGIVLKSQGKLQEAEEVYSFAINKYGGTQLLFLNRAQLFFDKKEYEKALRDFDLCNTPRSRALSLAILHILGRNDEVFERIKAGPEEDSENLRVSAIASFIAEREKKENPHSFCKNPLDFVYFSNISSHFKDSEKFISELIDELLTINSTSC